MRKNASKRAAELAACIVAMADLQTDLLKLEGKLTPEIENGLTVIQESAYSSVPADHEQEFGLTLVAIQGAFNGTITEGTAGTQPEPE